MTDLIPDDDYDLADDLVDDYDQDDIALLEEEEEEDPGVGGRLQVVAYHAANHPRLTCGGGTLLVSLTIDLFVHFDPLITILGLAAAATLGWRGEDLMGALVPGSDQEQAQQDAERFADRMLADYPVYADQSVRAKLRRLFRLEEGEVVDSSVEDTPLPKKRPMKKIGGPASNTSGEGLTYNRIAAWFDEGRIDNNQFFALLERLDNGSQISTRSARSVAHQPTSEADVDGQNMACAPAALPPGWTKEKMDLIPGLYRALGSLDKCLDGVEVSRYPRNRDFARDILKQQGLWKEK